MDKLDRQTPSKRSNIVRHEGKYVEGQAIWGADGYVYI